MPVSKRPRRKRPATSPWASSGRLDLLVSVVVGLTASIALLSVAVFWWEWWQDKDAFAEAAARGQPALLRVETIAEDRTGGAPITDPFPTSGSLDPAWTRAGFYTDEIPPGRLVHSLARGNIVIYYDLAAPAVLETLRHWIVLLSTGPYQLVVVPKASLGTAVVLTAWTKRLRLDPFDPEAAAAFITAFKGKAPAAPGG